MDQQRIRPESLDYTLAAIAPVFIIGMIGSIVYFLVTLFCQGENEYVGRLMWILGLYTLATVLISRIALEQSRAHSYGYLIVLAAATLLVTPRFFVMSGPLAPLSFPFLIVILALIAYLADRITMDCTSINEQKRSNGEGLLQSLGLMKSDRQKTSPSERDTAAPVERPKRNHNPGVWVLYFSLIALPLFGLGQLVIQRAEDRRWAFLCLFAYLISSFCLLVLIALLSLRKYLRERGVAMESGIAMRWLAIGMCSVTFLILLLSLMPVPSHSILSMEMPFRITSRDDLEAHRWGWGGEGAKNPGQDKGMPKAGRGPQANAPQPGDAPKGAQNNGKPNPGGQNPNGQPQGNDNSGSSGSGNNNSGAQGEPSKGDSSNSSSSNSSSSNQNPSSSSSSKSDPSKSSSDSKSSPNSSGSQPSSTSQSNASQSGDSNQPQSKSNQQPNNASAPKRSNDTQSSSANNQEQPKDSSQNGNQRDPSDKGQATPPQGNEPKDAPKREPPNNQPAEKNGRPPEDRAQQNQQPAEQPPGKPNPDGQQQAKQELKKQEQQGVQKRQNPEASSSRSPSIEWNPMAALQWLLMLIVAAVAAYFCWTQRRELRESLQSFLDWLKNWFGADQRHATSKTPNVESPSEALPPFPAFASFANPFGPSASRWSNEQLVRHIYQAVLSWGYEHRLPCSAEETPEEYLNRLSRRFAAQKDLFYSLGFLYNRIAYARSHVHPEEVSPLSDLWKWLERT